MFNSTPYNQIQIKMQRIIILLFLVSAPFLYSQEIKITVIDSLNQTPVSEAIALDHEGQFLAKSNSKGDLWINGNNTKIYIAANGYQQLTIPVLPKTPIVCKIIKNSEILKEVIVGGKVKVIKYGNLNLKNHDFAYSQVCDPDYKNFVCATKIRIKKNSFLSFYNFCTYKKIKNAPFNFQIYNDKNGVPDQVIYSQFVKDYEEGWCRIAIDNPDFMLKPGMYYIAMQWIPLQDKSDVWVLYENEEKKVLAEGQLLSINKGDGKQLDSFVYKNQWKRTQTANSKFFHYTQFIEVIEE
jgi:hypothetical protein